MRGPVRIPSVVAVLLLLLASACSPPPGEEPAPQQEEATVRIRNDSWLDMTVYVIAGGHVGGQRTRLGTVTSTSTMTFRIPRRIVGMGGDVSFVVDPVGSDNVAQSYRLFVRPGQEVSLTIPSSVR